MVAGDDHSRHSLPHAAHPHKCAVKQLLRFSGWILAVEDVAGNNECVYVSLNDNLFDTFKNFSVLVLARISVKRLAKMPVRSVKNTDHELTQLPSVVTEGALQYLYAAIFALRMSIQFQASFGNQP